MLVYKDGDTQKDILGFQCDLCNRVTMTDVIPNKYGEFRYICPKCGHKMKELDKTATENKEETTMVNTYTIANAAKRLNCSTSTVARAIRDGRFHDCFTEAGHPGHPTWMIPSDQVEAWVTSGGFVQPRKKGGSGGFIPRKEQQKNKMPAPVRTVFDPEVGKEVAVLNLLSEEDLKPREDEFMKRAVKRVAKDRNEEKKYMKVLERSPEPGKTANKLTGKLIEGGIITERDTSEKPVAGRYPWGNDGGDFDGDTMTLVGTQEVRKKMLEEFRSRPVVRTDSGFSITIPSELIEDVVQKHVKTEIAGTVSQLRTALDLLNDELKKLEEAIA